MRGRRCSSMIDAAVSPQSVPKVVLQCFKMLQPGKLIEVVFQHLPSCHIFGLGFRV